MLCLRAIRTDDAHPAVAQTAVSPTRSAAAVRCSTSPPVGPGRRRPGAGSTVPNPGRYEAIDSGDDVRLRPSCRTTVSVIGLRPIALAAVLELLRLGQLTEQRRRHHPVRPPFPGGLSTAPSFEPASDTWSCADTRAYRSRRYRGTPRPPGDRGNRRSSRRRARRRRRAALARRGNVDGGAVAGRVNKLSFSTFHDSPRMVDTFPPTRDGGSPRQASTSRIEAFTRRWPTLTESSVR
jgi:hypothetical protein